MGLTVAHRALVAYERPDGRYDVHTSRCGGFDCRLAGAITSLDPYAGGAIDPVPRVVARPFADVLTMVDLARHEALYRVTREYTVQPYLSLWFGFGHYLGQVDPEQRPEGCLLSVTGAEDATQLRQWFQTVKTALADAVLAGSLEETEAIAVLADIVDERAVDREVLSPYSASNG